MKLDSLLQQDKETEARLIERLRENNAQVTRIQRDIEEAFARDDADREAGREFKAMGHDCDRKQWERVRSLWKGKQND